MPRFMFSLSNGFDIVEARDMVAACATVASRAKRFQRVDAVVELRDDGAPVSDQLTRVETQNQRRDRMAREVARRFGWREAPGEPAGTVEREASECERAANLGQPVVYAHSWADACRIDGSDY